VRGQRLKLVDLGLSTDFEISIRVGTRNGLVVDLTFIALDEQDRLSDERYFVFFNQKQTPCGGVTLLGPSEGNLEVLRVALGKLPTTISRLIVVAAIDGPGKMSDLSASAVCLRANRIGIAEFAFSGDDLGDETALMMIELYRKSGMWRIAALGQGFAGGLAALLQHFGANVA
jgi:stress response protein SCP2